MTEKSKQMYSGVALVVVLALAVWFVNSKKTDQGQPPASTEQESNQPQNPKTQGSQDDQNQMGSWQGTLKQSNDTSKGNLMLITDNGVVYIHSSRDFSSLIGKTVKVSYSGFWTNFKLIDITEAQ